MMGLMTQLVYGEKDKQYGVALDLSTIDGGALMGESKVQYPVAVCLKILICGLFSWPHKIPKYHQT
jgi:hypothetical protein